MLRQAIEGMSIRDLERFYGEAGVALRSFGDVSDLVSDAICKGLEEEQLGNEVLIPRAWLLQTARRKGCNRQRRKDVEINHQEAVLRSKNLASATAQEKMLQEEAREQVLQAWKALPAENARVIGLWLMGLTCPQIAACLDWPAKNVKKRLADGLSALRDALWPYFEA